MRLGSKVVVFSMTVAFASSSASVAQERPTPPSFYTPLAGAERERVLRGVTSNARVRDLVGAKPRAIVSDPLPDKGEAQHYALDANAPAPIRLVTITLLDPQTNRAARVAVDTDGRIRNIVRIDAGDVPFTYDDAAEALSLVRASAPANRAIPRLQEFRLHRSGSPIAATDRLAQLLPLRSADPRDACAHDRCADLIFGTPAGYLSVRAHVDLSKRTVVIEGASR